MDIQLATAPAASTGLSAAGTSSGAASQASGTASGKATNFAVILGGQNTGGANGQSAGKLVPDDQTASLIGLLQMLQTLLSPLQNQLLAGASSEQQAAATMPDMLLQAISNPSSLSDQLLQDPNLQQWLAQASALLPTLYPASGTPLLTNANPSMNASDASVTLKLTAQQTLLQFAAAMKQMPDNPIVRHLMTELQHAVEPMLAHLDMTEASAAAEKIPSGNDKTSLAVDAAKPSASHTIAQAAHSEEPMIVSSVTVHSSSEAQLQQTKAKLEMLAAKSGGIVSSVQQLLSGDATEQGASNSSSQDSASSLPMPTPPLLDLLKTLQQAQTPFRPETQATINSSAFVRDMSEFMANNMKLSVGATFKEARLSLHPEHLGQIDVKITLHANGQLVAQLVSDTMAGKQLLESQLPQLRQALQNQGIQVERLEVAQEQAASSSMFQQSRQQGGGGQPFGRESRGNRPDTDAVDAEFAKDLRTLANLRSDDGGGSGGAFDVSA